MHIFILIAMLLALVLLLGSTRYKPVRREPTGTQAAFTAESLRSLGGSTLGVKLVWTVVFGNWNYTLGPVTVVPFLLSLVVVYIAAYFGAKERSRNPTDKELFVAFFNTLLVYCAVLGIPV